MENINCDFENALNIRNKNIHNPFIGYLNINSLRNKIHVLRYLMAKLTPAVISISETKIDETFPDVQFIVDGYSNPIELRKDRNKHGGGLITYIRHYHFLISDCLKLTQQTWKLYVLIFQLVRRNGALFQYIGPQIAIYRYSLRSSRYALTK